MRSTIKNGKIVVINEQLIEKHEKPIKEENKEIVEETTAQEEKSSKHVLFDNIIHKAKHQRIKR